MVVSSFKNKKMSHKVSRISSATFTKFNTVTYKVAKYEKKTNTVLSANT